MIRNLAYGLFVVFVVFYDELAILHIELNVNRNLYWASFPKFVTGIKRIEAN